MRAKHWFALQDASKTPKDYLPSTRVSCLCIFQWQVLIYFVAWASFHACSSASRLRTPFAAKFVSLLRSVCTASCFFLFMFFARRFQERRQEAKKVSVADDRMDYYTVRAAPASAGHDSRSTQVAVHAGLTGINDSFHMNGPCPERFETPLRRCTRVCSLRLFFVLVVVLAIGDLRMKATAHLTFKQPLFHPTGCQNLSKLGWQMGQI